MCEEMSADLTSLIFNNIHSQKISLLNSDTPPPPRAARG